MRVILTGSRKWADKKAVFTALEDLFREHGPYVLVHGACATGADAIADEWVRLTGEERGVFCVRYRADWENRGQAAGPERNARMVKTGADLVVAFPLPGGSGTQHTMRLAREAGIEVREFTHA